MRLLRRLVRLDYSVSIHIDAELWLSRRAYRSCSWVETSQSISVLDCSSVIGLPKVVDVVVRVSSEWDSS